MRTEIGWHVVRVRRTCLSPYSTTRISLSGKLINKGKYIAGYDRRITFPVGAHIYFEGNICEVIRSISGYKAPAGEIYWEEYTETVSDTGDIQRYSQFGTYYPKDIVLYNDVLYICTAEIWI
ncbi:hypothetical protein ACNOHN_16865 [Bacteroides zhangwenhongii]|uniref:hypothetical protein n=1 Tax=Bacteroides zhangwenhongii TaxID=2650157 RepID=UPI003AAF8636